MEIAYDSVSWGDTLCNRKCMRVAEGLYEGEPLCTICASEQIEYDVAIAENPALVFSLLAPNVRD